MSNLPIREVVVHCTATLPTLNIGAKELTSWHKRRGWRTIGYHFVIKRDGTIELGRPVEQQGAHVRGHNRNSLGIVLVGGVNSAGKPATNYSPAQFKALALLLRACEEDYPSARISGHRDFSPDLNGNGIIESNERVKECPCFDVKTWWADYQQGRNK